MKPAQAQRSNATNFQSLLAFTMGHIPTKLHQFQISSFFMNLHKQTQRDRQKQHLLPA